MFEDKASKQYVSESASTEKERRLVEKTCTIAAGYVDNDFAPFYYRVTIGNLSEIQLTLNF